MNIDAYVELIQEFQFQNYYRSNTEIWTCISAEGLKDKHL